MGILKNIFATLVFFTGFSVFAQGRQIAGSGSLSILPGRTEEERRVMNQDIARSHPGDYFWREIKPEHNGKIIYSDKSTGKNWGWLYIVHGDIDWAKKNNFMAGFKPKLPDMDSSGEKYMEYQKSPNYSRKLYEKGAVQDVLTKQSEFDKAFAEFKKKYPNPVPRRAKNITGATNWFYLDDVPKDFPQTFWASITLEGRVMKVIIANGPAHRIAVSYWAQDDYMKEFPGASWSWQGKDKAHGMGAKKIQEDISQSAAYYEFSK
ncbi:MAG: hypothetical protein Pg6A_08790 [Termitinemataceae bacterium]|nr:MAG: hypothetical protein Pg6A_08790 [Termitinemataceae bacterium]